MPGPAATMVVWSPRHASRVYHHCVDVVMTPRGKRFVTACGKHLVQVMSGIGIRSIPDNERRRRRVCPGCAKMTNRGR